MLPVCIGVHLSKLARNFLRNDQTALLKIKELEIGARDISTLKFLKSIGVKSYLSRCLTLTFPQRAITQKQKSVYIVDVPQKYLPFIPKTIIPPKQFSLKYFLANSWEG